MPWRPRRTCIGCRRRADAAELLRVAGLPDGAIVVDRHAPGRGAWLCPDPSCWAAAERRAGFDRALRRRHEPAVVAALVAPDGPLAARAARTHRHDGAAGTS